MQAVNTYSVLPSIQQFLTPDYEGESHMKCLCAGLMDAQMDLSRLIMYKHDDPHNANESRMVHNVMSIVADLYDLFQSFEEERKRYDKLQESLKAS